MKLTKEELEEIERADAEIDRDFAEAFPEDDGTDLKLDIDALADRVAPRPRSDDNGYQCQYYYRHRAEIAVKQAARYRQHREKYLIQSAKYHSEHKDVRKLRYLANKEKVLQQYHQYYQAHKAAILARQAAYRETHRDEIRRKANEKNAARRLAKQKKEAKEA